MPGEAAAGTWAGDAASSRATHGACSMLGASTPARAAGTCAEQSGLKAGNTPLLSPSHSVETPSLTSGMAVLLFSHPGSFLEPHLMCPDPRIGWTCPLSRSRGPHVRRTPLSSLPPTAECHPARVYRGSPAGPGAVCLPHPEPAAPQADRLISLSGAAWALGGPEPLPGGCHTTQPWARVCRHQAPRGSVLTALGRGCPGPAVAGVTGHVRATVMRNGQNAQLGFHCI